MAKSANLLCMKIEFLALGSRICHHLMPKLTSFVSKERQHPKYYIVLRLIVGQSLTASQLYIISYRRNVSLDVSKARLR
jgi:hypothetical protein